MNRVTRLGLPVPDAVEKRVASEIETGHAFSGQLPWSSENYDLDNTVVAGATASLLFTNGLMSTRFNMIRLQNEDKDPLVVGRDEVGFDVNGEAGSFGDIATASNRELQIINDADPLT